MPAISAISVSGHDYIPENFKLNFKRQVSVQGIPTSDPGWGTLTFSVVMEMESDSDTFLAAWMAAPYQTYTVDIICHNTLSNQTFLNIKMENALCIDYSIDATGSPSDEKPADSNGKVFVTIASPTVTVGQATIGVKAA
jgi:hypothetical protein